MKYHNRSQSRSHKPQTKRVPADFGWVLLRLLLKELSSSLPEEFVNDYTFAIRHRDGELYMKLMGKWTPQSIWSACGDTTGEAANKVVMKVNLASCYLITKLLAKWPGLEVKSERQRVADAYQLFSKLEERPRPAAAWDLTDPVILRMRALLTEWLGIAPNAEEIAEVARHGPGSTTGVPYRYRSNYYKFLRWPYHVSAGAHGLLKAVIQSDERWCGALEQSYRTTFDLPAWSILNRKEFWKSVLTHRESNIIVTVPKDAAKNRLIAKEPTGNVYLQLGVGSIMKARLRRIVDLTDQRTNQRLAKEGSLSSSSVAPCTFDLSNASDTIQYDVVQTLLPPDWFQLLCCIRSEWGEIPGRASYPYRKMSSMGNATTFELESAIFMSLLLAVSMLYGNYYEDRPKINVFGDDLVFPRYLAPTVSMYLSALGFEVNHSKSFVAGSFMESCGHDYWDGTNIRPVFLRETPACVPSLLSARNRLHRWFSVIWGTNIPHSVEEYILSYIRDRDSVPVGPETDDEFDTYLHAFSGRRFDVSFQSYVRVVPRDSGKDLWFRKLMHDLRSHQDNVAAGSRFDVTGEEGGAIRKTWRSLCVRTYYTDMDGSAQDFARPAWEEIPRVAR